MNAEQADLARHLLALAWIVSSGIFVWFPSRQLQSLVHAQGATVPSQVDNGPWAEAVERMGRNLLLRQVVLAAAALAGLALIRAGSDPGGWGTQAPALAAGAAFWSGIGCIYWTYRVAASLRDCGTAVDAALRLWQAQAFRLHTVAALLFGLGMGIQTGNGQATPQAIGMGIVVSLSAFVGSLFMRFQQKEKLMSAIASRHGA